MNMTTSSSLISEWMSRERTHGPKLQATAGRLKTAFGPRNLITAGTLSTAVLFTIILGRSWTHMPGEESSVYGATTFNVKVNVYTVDGDRLAGAGGASSGPPTADSIVSAKNDHALAHQEPGDVFLASSALDHSSSFEDDGMQAVGHFLPTTDLAAAAAAVPLPLPITGAIAGEWDAALGPEPLTPSLSTVWREDGNGTLPTIFDSEEEYISKQERLRAPTRTGSLSELGRSAYWCTDPERRHCIFDNICVRNPGGENATWFALNDMPGYDGLPLQLKDLHNVYFELKLGSATDKDMAGKVRIMDENVHMFNPMHDNRFFLFSRAFSLWMQTRTLSEGKPYHVMYFTPADFNERMFYELMTPMTYKDRPMYLYPHGLQQDGRQAAETVCFRRVEFGWARVLTWLLAGPTERYDELMTMGQWHGHEIFEEDASLRVLMPRFREFYAAKMAADGVSMVAGRALLVTRNKDKNAMRMIVNEAEIIKVLEKHGLEVDVVDFAQLNNTEQIQRTRQASLFVGMHGAGMANLVWLDPKAVVLELHPYGFQKWGYERLARYVNQPYVSWVNQKEEHSFLTPASSKYQSVQENRNFYRHRDQYVTPSEFEERLLEALAKSRESNSS